MLNAMVQEELFVEPQPEPDSLQVATPDGLVTSMSKDAFQQMTDTYNCSLASDVAVIRVAHRSLDTAAPD